MPLIGVSAHERAVRRAQADVRALPAGGLRLAKRTSNLFRRREQNRAGLDVSGLAGVIDIDTAARTADVQGMCTYETLVAATLERSLMPLVVPQLKTITLGGAVTGLGVESTSLFDGLPHESVEELDILLGSGDVVTASRTENADLFYAFPNSYGSLGYAMRVRIRLAPVDATVALRHVRFTDRGQLADAVATIAEDKAWDGEPVDFVDGVTFSPHESYLTLGRHDGPGATSDYTGQQIYYRSLRERDTDRLTTSDYLWRWDTDWFWCSQAFGAQHPLVRRVWPRRLRRSDVYHRLVALEGRYQITDRLARWRHQPARERVIQDVELPLDRTAEFLDWFDRHVGMTPVWLCPMRAHESWPLYPLQPGQVYVNVGFWGTVPIEAGKQDGDVNRAIEQLVTDLGGHKSLYSDVFYDRSTFDKLYGANAYRAAKDKYDPQGRLSDMYEKVVGNR